MRFPSLLSLSPSKSRNKDLRTSSLRKSLDRSKNLALRTGTLNHPNDVDDPPQPNTSTPSPSISISFTTCSTPVHSPAFPFHSSTRRGLLSDCVSPNRLPQDTSLSLPSLSSGKLTRTNSRKGTQFQVNKTSLSRRPVRSSSSLKRSSGYRSHRSPKFPLIKSSKTRAEKQSASTISRTAQETKKVTGSNPKISARSLLLQHSHVGPGLVVISAPKSTGCTNRSSITTASGTSTTASRGNMSGKSINSNVVDMSSLRPSTSFTPNQLHNEISRRMVMPPNLTISPSPISPVSTISVTSPVVPGWGRRAKLGRKPASSDIIVTPSLRSLYSAILRWEEVADSPSLRSNEQQDTSRDSRTIVNEPYQDISSSSPILQATCAAAQSAAKSPATMRKYSKRGYGNRCMARKQLFPSSHSSMLLPLPISSMQSNSSYPSNLAQTNPSVQLAQEAERHINSITAGENAKMRLSKEHSKTLDFDQLERNNSIFQDSACDINSQIMFNSNPTTISLPGMSQSTLAPYSAHQYASSSARHSAPNSTPHYTPNFAPHSIYYVPHSINHDVERSTNLHLSLWTRYRRLIVFIAIAFFMIIIITLVIIIKHSVT